MSLGFRVFFLDQNEVLVRIPLKRFEGFYLRSDKRERFPNYAGQRIRYALVTLELKQRKPIAIKRIDCWVIKLNNKGELDEREWLRGATLGVNMASGLQANTSTGPVIDATSRFAKKRYEHEFRWIPSPEIIDSIDEAVFGKGKKPKR